MYTTLYVYLCANNSHHLLLTWMNNLSKSTYCIYNVVDCVLAVRMRTFVCGDLHQHRKKNPNTISMGLALLETRGACCDIPAVPTEPREEFLFLVKSSTLRELVAVLESVANKFCNTRVCWFMDNKKVV